MFLASSFTGGQGYFWLQGRSSLPGLLLCDSRHGGGYALASALFLGNGWVLLSRTFRDNLAQIFVGMALGYVVYYAFQKKGS